VRATTAPRWRAALEALGLERIYDSSAFIGARRFFNVTASRWPARELPPLGAPQPERVLSLRLETPAGELELHNAHVPPAQSAGLTKVETCEALFHHLARPAAHHRVLCGDLNMPKLETTEGELITFAGNHPQLLERWDAAERSLLSGLAEWDLRDQFRLLNGYDRRDVSWIFNTRSVRRSGHRLDHVLASSSLNTIACDYEHGWRDAGLSDHSAIEAVFEPDC
jgi:endonuclease/exonuclease/phosphatase family metal-dependent hydrolase